MKYVTAGGAILTEIEAHQAAEFGYLSTLQHKLRGKTYYKGPGSDFYLGFLFTPRRLAAT